MLHAIVVAGLVMVIQQAPPEQAGEPPTAEAPLTAEAIAQAVAELGDPSFAVREQATQRLWQAGPAAEASLRAALKSTDPEVRARARSLVDKLRFGIRPETSPEVLALIEQFRYAGAKPVQRQALMALQSHGQWEVILALLRGEEDEERRRTLAAAVADESGKLIRPLLESGQLDAAERVLALTADTDTGEPQLAALLLVTGRLGERIAQLEKRLASSPQPAEWRRLALLLRAQGNADEAAEAAAHTGDDALHASLLAEAGRWSEAAVLMELLYGKNGDQLDLAAFAATFYRLAGDEANYERVLERIAEKAGVTVTAEGFEPPDEIKTAAIADLWVFNEALLINEQVERALSVLRATNPAQAHTLLWRRHQHEEALKLLNIDEGTVLDRAWFEGLPAAARSLRPATSIQLATQAARQLRELGRQEQLAQLMETLRGEVAANPDAGRRWTALAGLQWQLDRHDDAFASAHQALLARQPPAVVFGGLLKQQGPLAAAWYEYLTSTDPSGDRQKQIATSVWLVVAQPPPGKLPDDWRTIVGDAVAGAAGLEPPQRAQRLLTMGETLLVRGARGDARDAFEEAAETLPQAAVKAGDLAVKEARWSEAAAWYAKANPDGDNLLATYLEGYALSELGESDRGAEKMRLASLGALSPNERALLAGGLVERGLREQGAEQFEIIRRTALPHSPHVVQAAQQVGNLVSRQEPRRAVRCWRQLLLHVLNRSSNFTETEGYLTLPHVCHKVSARAALAESDLEACERELEACAQILPGDVALVVEFVPLLDKAERQELATALFARSFDVHRAVVDAFPQSATSLNNTAWLAARSQRSLEEALALVERALALAPDEPAYLDTLAEVHFQRGDRPAAVAAARRAAELSPASDFARQRLAHFETSEVKTLDETNR